MLSPKLVKWQLWEVSYEPDDVVLAEKLWAELDAEKQQSAFGVAMGAICDGAQSGEAKCLLCSANYETLSASGEFSIAPEDKSVIQAW